MLLALAVMLPLAFDLGFFTAGLLPAPKHPDEVAPVDLIAVLTGGQGRLKEALQFLRNGKGQYLFVSGTDPKSQWLDILKANHLDPGTDDIGSKVILDDESRSTADNAVKIRHMAEKLGVQSILVVTSNYHVRRAMRLMEQEFRREPAMTVSVSAYPVESPNFSAHSWWKSLAGWRILFSEYFKSRVGDFY